MAKKELDSGMNNVIHEENSSELEVSNDKTTRALVKTNAEYEKMKQNYERKLQDMHTNLKQTIEDLEKKYKESQKDLKVQLEQKTEQCISLLKAKEEVTALNKNLEVELKKLQEKWQESQMMSEDLKFKELEKNFEESQYWIKDLKDQISREQLKLQKTTEQCNCLLKVNEEVNAEKVFLIDLVKWQESQQMCEDQKIKDLEKKYKESQNCIKDLKAQISQEQSKLQQITEQCCHLLQVNEEVTASNYNLEIDLQGSKLTQEQIVQKLRMTSSLLDLCRVQYTDEFVNLHETNDASVTIPVTEATIEEGDDPQIEFEL